MIYTFHDADTAKHYIISLIDLNLISTTAKDIYLINTSIIIQNYHKLLYNKFEI